MSSGHDTDDLGDARTVQLFALIPDTVATPNRHRDMPIEVKSLTNPFPNGAHCDETSRTPVNETFTIFEIPICAASICTNSTDNSESTFLGALVDTGAQRSVMGRKQALAYLRTCTLQPLISNSRTKFRFGSMIVNAIASIELNIETPGIVISTKVDVVECDVPLLLGLELLDKYGLQALTVFNVLESVPERWHAPLLRKGGHVYYQWMITETAPFQIAYTANELMRIHRHFAHPSAR